jgi:dolichol-phosphate mannosyltransferase
VSVLVVVPTYNEAATLPSTLARLRAAVPGADVLVVDDGSPDGTGALADALAAVDPAVHVLHRTEKAGLGAAYLAGFAWGLARGYELLVEMDADGSHQPEQLPRLLDGVAAGADLVIGARWVPGGSVANWPRRRELLSRAGNRYVRLVTDLPLHDATAGFRVFRRAVLEAICDDVASQGYCFQVDMARRAVRAGFVVAEVPIDFVERTAGVSKMSGAIVREALWRVTVWGLADRLSPRRPGVPAPRRPAAAVLSAAAAPSTGVR